LARCKLKYKNKVGKVQSVSKQTCTLIVDGKKTGNIYFKSLEVAFNGSSDNRREMETPVRITLTKDDVKKGQEYKILDGKYKNKVGKVQSVSKQTCTLIVDGKKTGNIYFKSLEVAFNGSSNKMETPSKVLLKRGERNNNNSHREMPSKTLFKEEILQEGKKFESTKTTATSKIIEAAEIADRIIKNVERCEFKEFLDKEHFRSNEANKTHEDYIEATKSKFVRVGVNNIRNKIVVFSTWKQVLSQAQETFRKKMNIDCSLRIDGDVTSMADRMKIIEKFNRKDSPQVIFCQIDTCGAGINLQTANVVFILDPKWSPALEWQARDRIWRLGSPHEAVYFYHFLIKLETDEFKKKKQDEKQKVWDKTVRLAEDAVDYTGPSEYRSRKKYAAEKRSFDAEVTDAGIIATLKTHQFTGVRWMQRQERGENPGQPGITGGILADDMGLGKTLQLLTLVKLDPNEERKPTLAVMPKTVFNSWISDCKKFIPGMEVVIYHDDAHAKSDFPTVETIKRKAKIGATIVLTNYHRLRDNSTDLMTIQWRRLILDESHVINNEKYGFDKACKLKCDYKWSVTGTPMKNNISDFSPHLKLIGADDKNIKCTDMKNADRINCVLLRRTKLALKSQGEKLPKCFINTHQWQNLTESEEIEYEREKASWHFLATFSKGSIYTGIRTGGQNARNPDSKREVSYDEEAEADLLTYL